MLVAAAIKSCRDGILKRLDVARQVHPGRIRVEPRDDRQLAHVHGESHRGSYSGHSAGGGVAGGGNGPSAAGRGSPAATGGAVAGSGRHLGGCGVRRTVGSIGLAAPILIGADGGDPRAVRATASPVRSAFPGVPLRVYPNGTLSLPTVWGLPCPSPRVLGMLAHRTHA